MTRFHFITIIVLSLVTSLASCASEASRSGPNAAPGSSIPVSTYDEEMYIASEGGHRHIIEKRLRAGKDINGVHPATGWTVLHAAAYHGHKELVGFLLISGSNVNALDKRGNTPLHLAVGRGHMDTVRSVISGAPDVSIRNLAGKTPTDLASSDMLAKFPQLKN